MQTNGTRPAAALPGQYIIGFKQGVTREQQLAAVRSLAPKAVEPLGLINGMLVVDPQRAITGRSLGGPLDSIVEYVQPNYRQYLRGPVEQSAPDDPEYPKQYHLQNTGQTGGTPGADVKAPAAWQTSTGEGVVVAVVDTNVDIDHPDLRPNIWVNEGEIAGNGVDDDGNGYVDDVHGWNFGRNSNRPQDGTSSHGTHVSGIVGAVTGNATGVAGTAPDVKIMPLAILTGGASTANAVKAFEYAVRNGAQVISNSWGNNRYEPALAAAVAQATEAGSMVIVAAGNENWDTGVHGSYPDNYAGSVAIAASDHKDRKASYSNRGTVTIDIAAPGDDILSATPRGRYGTMSGTSMAAPVYAGVAALVKAAYPALTMKQVEERIFRSAQKDGSAADWNSLVASGGRVDAAAALLPIATPADPQPVSRSVPQAGSPVTVGWTSDITDGQSFEVQASLNASAAAPVHVDFEAGPQRNFRTYGDATWSIGDVAARSGGKAMHVEGLRREKRAVLELTETLAEPTTVEFWYRSASGGELSFFIDRNLQFQPTADDTWRHFEAQLPAGEHTFTWHAAGRGGRAGTIAIDDLKIGSVSEATWEPVATVKDTFVEWTPSQASADAAVRVRASNGRWSGDWVTGPGFEVASPERR